MERKNYPRLPFGFSKFGRLPLSENAFISDAERRGFTVLKSGWPDVLIHRRGIFYAVEIKSGPQDKPKPNQLEMHAALKECGLPVLVAWPGYFPHEIKTAREEWLESVKPKCPPLEPHQK